MNFKIFIVILSVSTFFSACSPPSALYYQSINVLPIYQDIDNKLYFSYADGDNTLIYRNPIISSKPRDLYLLNDDTKLWEKIAIKDGAIITILSEDYNSTKLEFLYRTLTTSMVDGSMISTQESISYEDNIVKLTDIDTKEIVFSETLPTKEEIRDATGIDLHNSTIKYYPLTEGQFYWDREDHIVTACINEIDDDCDEVYAFSLLQNINSSWSIENIIDYSSGDDYLWGLYDYIDINKREFNKIGTLEGETGSFIKTNTGVVVKYFKDIHPQDYIDMIDEIYSSSLNYAYNYTIDEQGNMHLFYNKREDIESGNYDYFWYGYFTKENPTTPLYEQRIEWK